MACFSMYKLLWQQEINPNVGCLFMGLFYRVGCYPLSISCYDISRNMKFGMLVEHEWV